LALTEATLRDFFQGKSSATQLAAEAATATKQVGPQTFHVHVSVLEGDEEFVIDAPMLVRLCDAVLAGDLPPTCLEPIGFALVCSEHLHWAEEDDLVPRVLYAWASPEINWKLTTKSVGMFRGWLTGEAEPPPEPKLDASPEGGQMVRRTEWVREPHSSSADLRDDA
jgi:hypothetical protein